MDFSIVIPVHNEEENIKYLYKQINDSLKEFSYEVIVVNDGSNDGTLLELNKIKDKKWKVLDLEHKGKDYAVYAGIQKAKSQNIVLMDGDLQVDVKDLVNLWKVFKKNQLDCVVGWRADRKDGFVKKVSSFVGNSFNNLFFGLKINDANCPLKIINRKLLVNVKFFNHFHRFICALISLQNGKIEEIKVKHLPRIHGKSHYGVHNRIFGNLISLFKVRFGRREIFG
ncbi:MAG: glycosyltransferase family 2 protein [Nanoarchaeota archaeon]